MKQKYLTLLAALLFASSAYAGDIASDVRSGFGGPDNSDGGYFEFGVGMNLRVNRQAAFYRATPIVAGAYRFKGFFLEALTPGATLPGGPIGGITLGYNVWSNERWAVDLLGVNSTWRPPTGPRGSRPDDPPKSERDDDLLDRRSFYNGAGVRLTGYFGKTIFQYRLVNDTHGGKGITSSARLGYSQQVKNWNFHGVVSADFTSQKTGQYWYGISAEEATARFPEYDVQSSSFAYSLDFGATYPVRENVVFRSTARYRQIDNTIAQSPLQPGEIVVEWNTSVSYVF